ALPRPPVQPPAAARHAGRPRRGGLQRTAHLRRGRRVPGLHARRDARGDVPPRAGAGRARAARAGTAAV
ncbi:MAG: hypothetical protein AVDCRST_MAG11-1914, partial [uncultured Gemmatimonadaceae bacterium]